MATNRKLGRTTDIRLAMLKTQVTDLLWHGKIETTETRAKETKAIADSLIALAVKEAGNFEEVEVKVSKAKLDEKGNKVTELVKSKNGREYLKVVREETTEKRKKDMPSKLNARRKIMRNVNKVKDADGKSHRVFLEIYSCANMGDKRFYIQSAFNIDDEAKKQQEINSLCRINDSFKKFVVIKDNIEPWQDDKGIQYIGIEQFLLEEEWLR